MNDLERLDKNDGKKKVYDTQQSRWNTFNGKIEIILRTNEIKLIRNIFTIHIFSRMLYLLEQTNICLTCHT